MTSLGTEAEVNTGMLVLNLVTSTVSSLIGFIILNMGLLISIFFYFDYRFRKEGLGLEFQQIAAQQATMTTTDRLDTSVDRHSNASDSTKDRRPVRHATGLHLPGPSLQCYQCPQSPPNQAGPNREAHGPPTTPKPGGYWMNVSILLMSMTPSVSGTGFFAGWRM